MLTRKDVKLIILLLAVGAVLLILTHLNRGGELYAQIIYGNHTEIVDLSEDRTFSIPQAPHVLFEVQHGRIAFVFSTCPDQICVDTSFLRNAGQIAACLPNNIILQINSVNENELDIFVR